MEHGSVTNMRGMFKPLPHRCSSLQDQDSQRDRGTLPQPVGGHGCGDDVRLQWCHLLQSGSVVVECGQRADTWNAFTSRPTPREWTLPKPALPVYCLGFTVRPTESRFSARCRCGR